MKNLIVMRHAKSDWGNNLPDIERPLNKRGKKSAPFMGEELIKRNKLPDLIISSPAKRAVSTAKRVIEAINYQKEMLIVKDFYFGYMEHILNSIREIGNENNIIMIVGHNPLWEDLVVELASDNDFIAMPTAAVASLVFEIDDWNLVKENSGKLEWIITPKGLKGK